MLAGRYCNAAVPRHIGVEFAHAKRPVIGLASTVTIFGGEKAYTVIEIEHARTDLQHGVLVGHASRDAIRPSSL
ncbi:hypothetical protein SAMN03159496_06004 [Rhizobium sp. NFR07]|nr:hypothetical protein SAMN03159496_06004 [Rhizobium sp. NFR07]